MDFEANAGWLQEGFEIPPEAEAEAEGAVDDQETF